MPTGIKNWVAETATAPNTGVVVLDGPERLGDVTFAQAFGPGPIEVLYSITDGTMSEAGYGTLENSTLKRDTVQATFDGTTYVDSNPTVLDFTNPVVVRCTANADAFAQLEPAFSKNTAFNKDFGTVADTVCEGDDPRLNDSRPALSHVHTESDISDLDKYTKVEVDAKVDTKIGAVIEDPNPELGGLLITKANHIVVSDDAGNLNGLLGRLDSGTMFVTYNVSGTYDPTDGGIAMAPYGLVFHGTTLAIESLRGTTHRQLRVSPEGTIYAVELPPPGWEVIDTGTDTVDLPDLSTWYPVDGLLVTIPEDVATGERLNTIVGLWMTNASDRGGGTVSVGFGFNGAAPTSVGGTKYLSAPFSGYVSFAVSLTQHAGFTTGDEVKIWARQEPRDGNRFEPSVDGSLGTHEFVLSKP